MAINLIIALIAIAGLGILALLLIFFGGASNKKKKNKPVNKAPVEQKQEANPALELEDEEPLEAVLPVQSVKSAKASAKANKPEPELVDPALASLGFSAIDDLLVEPESVPAVASKKKTTTELPKQTPKKRKTPAEKDLIALYVLAPAGYVFVGYELVQTLVASGLRFGEMDIFHRYDESAKPHKILFSVCAAVEPGIFDMTNVGAINCPGLSLFMKISAVDDSVAVFNLMLETAQQLTEELQGILCDGQRKPLSKTVLKEYQQRAEETVESV